MSNEMRIFWKHTVDDGDCGDVCDDDDDDEGKA
jgi:hypothetical protein